MANFNPRNPTRHTGTDKYITFFVTRSRSPTTADFRQPETGNLYSIGTVWQVGKDPTTGTEGDLWMLSKIVSNLGYWIKIASGTTPSGAVLSISDTSGTLVYPTAAGTVQLEGTTNQIVVTSSPGSNKLTLSLAGGGTAVDSVAVQATTSPGVTPVTATTAGLITVNGNSVANHSVPVESRSRALNTYNIEVQYATSAAATDATKSGLAHFNSTNFSVDASGFVSLAGTGAGQTITGQSGGALAPTAGNWNIYGLGEMTTSGSGSTLSILQPRNNHIIVDPTSNYGTHQTIAAAIAAASSGDTIFIRPGTYTENNTISKTLKFFAYSGNSSSSSGYGVSVTGKFTVSSGLASFENINFTQNGSNIFDVSGNSCELVINNCSLDCGNQAGINSNGSTNNIYVQNCYVSSSNSGTLYAISNSTTIRLRNVWSSSVTGTPATSTNDGGIVLIQGCRLSYPMSSANAGVYDIQNSMFGTNIPSYTDRTYLTTAGTGTHYIFNSCFASGTASTISVGAGTTVQMANCEANSSNANVLTGAGTLKYAGIVFTGSSTGHNVTTETALTVFG